MSEKTKKTKIENERPQIVATADCRIVAAQAEEGKPEKLPRVEIEAYNGGIMNVRWWGPVVIDLAGLEASDSVPLLYGHGDYSVETILGQSDSVDNDGKRLRIAGDIMGESRTTREVKALSKNGFKWQASVGVDPKQHSEVEAGADVEVNGQTLAGPFTLIEKSKLNETSIVPLGADGSTSARIAAKQNGAVAPDKQEVNMKVDANGNPIEGAKTEGQPTAEQIRAEAVAEQTRIGKVSEVAKDHPEISAQAVKDGWSPEQT
jgi:hypothetical protein